MINKKKFATVDEFIANHPEHIQKQLELFRQTIKKAAPAAEEIISYNMPAYRINRVLVYFAAAKTHYGLYPTPGPIIYFKDKLEPFQTSKGAIQFPLDKPLPVKLIREIVLFRVAENAENAQRKTPVKSRKK